MIPLAPALLILNSENMKLSLLMLLVFGAAKLLAELFEILGQPGMVGEVLAGVLIGPSVLGWISPNEIVSTLADLGVMFLLFRVGLDVKSCDLLKVGGTGLLVASFGVVVPFFAGVALLSAWGNRGSRVSSWGLRWWRLASESPLKRWLRKVCWIRR
jgi:Kef-type K+ transport system membrane component KefB